MDIWTVLDISPDSDRRTIKRAYAKKLKSTRPDQDKVAFQNLHQAYKQALHEWEYAQYELQQEAERQGLKVETLKQHTPSDDEGAAGKIDHSATNVHRAEPSVSESEHVTSYDDEHITLEVDSSAERVYSDRKRHLATKADIQIEASNELDQECQVDEVCNEVVETTLEKSQIEAQEHQGDHASEKFESEELKTQNVDEAIDVLLEKVKSLLYDQQSRNKLEAWQFLSYEPMLLDHDIHNHIAYKTFDLVATYNQNTYGNLSELNRLKPAVLDYLDSIFLWRNYAGYYANEFEHAEGAKLIDRLEDADGALTSLQDDFAAIRGSKDVQRQVDQQVLEKLKSAQASMLKRFYAAVADCMFGLFCLLPLTAMPFFERLDVTNISFFVTYLIVTLSVATILESSRYQASIGKLLLGMKVMDEHQRKASLLKNILRNLVLGLLVITFVWIERPQYLLIIMLLDGIRNHRQLQEKVTNLYVIDLSKYEQLMQRKYAPVV